MLQFNLKSSQSKATFTRPGRSEDGEEESCSVNVFELANTIQSLAAKIHDIDEATENQFSSQVTSLVASNVESINTAVNITASVVGPAAGRIDALYEDITEMKNHLKKHVTVTLENSGSYLTESVDEINATLIKGREEALSQLDEMNRALDAQKAEIEKTTKDLETKYTALAGNGEQVQVYTRWGHTQCPTGHTKWYDGVMYAGHYGHSGSGDMECLIRNSKNNGGVDTGTSSLDLVYPMAMDHNHGSSLPRGTNFGCAKCISKTPCFEARGLNTCPKDYKMVYNGYLVGSHYGHRLPQQRVCVDQSPNAHYGSYNGGYMYVTRVQAGSSNIRTGVSVRCGMCCKA